MSITSNIQQFLKELDAEDVKIQKAQRAAVKIEAFRLKKLLQDDLRKGSIAGKPFAPLREITKEYRGRNKNAPPLSPLAKVIRYFGSETGNSFRMEIGFVGNISKKWVEIATRQQAGATYEVRPGVKAALRSIGGRLAGKKKSRGRARLFFITAKTFTDPARDIINTFYNAHAREIFTNIKNNFDRKMRGERI